MSIDKTKMNSTSASHLEGRDPWVWGSAETLPRQSKSDGGEAVNDNITLRRAVALQIREALMVAATPIPADRHTVKAALAALDAALAEPDAIAAKYNELLMAVAQKHPDETRHETALRYITQAENQSNAPDRAQEVKP